MEKMNKKKLMQEIGKINIEIEKLKTKREILKEEIRDSKKEYLNE
jgi:hypothetical protein